MTPPGLGYLSAQLNMLQQQLEKIQGEQRRAAESRELAMVTAATASAQVSQIRKELDRIQEDQRASRRWLMGIMATLAGLVLSTGWQFVVNGGLASHAHLP